MKQCYEDEILGILRRDPVESLDFTPFELKVLELVFNYCRYSVHRRIKRSPEYIQLKKPEDFYVQMKALVESGQKIRSGTIKLSSLIGDPQMSKLVKQVEQPDESY
ncbi:MAG: hypothetical protein KME26_03605 [Oscillatoria princeps RMCB-10]|nr:hypothetical protein [Oscillatoria princeps RMCB-10]